MNLRHLTAAALGAAALTLLPGAAKAADTIDFAAAGSSAQFSSFTLGFIAQGYTNHYSLGSSSNFTIIDANANPENAQVAIYWKGSAGNYQIAVFYQVDSTVGCRAYFNNDTLTASSAPPAPTNVGQPGSGDVTPPLEVLQAVNGTAVTIGATDITPEDARVATARSIALGYSAAKPIKSAVANSSAQADPVPFSITSKSFKLIPLGAVPIVVFVNGPTFSAIPTTVNSNANPNLNIDGFQLAGFLSGQLNRTSDLILASGAAANPVHVYVREPLSGTYNTLEYTNPESVAKIPFTGGKISASITASGGQELNVSTNPLNEPASGSADFNAPAGSGRIRAVGTGELVGAANRDTVDSIGYAFYSAGTFTGLKNAAGTVIPTTVKYLTVDGADPLQDSYSGGTLPSSSVTFRNIINGGYPLWSILRVVAPTNPSAIVTNIINSAISSANGTDFVPATSLRIFRSYHQTPFTPSGMTVNNGNNGSAAAGGDVGGAVFSINNDVDAFNDFGSDLSNVRQ